MGFCARSRFASRHLSAHAPRDLAPLTQIIVFRHGGAVNRVPDGDTAFGNRGDAYILHSLAAWMAPEDDDRHIAWLRELVAAMEPCTTGGVYLNFTPNDDDRVPDGFGADSHAKLVARKDRYDPTHVPLGLQHQARRRLSRSGGRSVSGPFRACRAIRPASAQPSVAAAARLRWSRRRRPRLSATASACSNSARYRWRSISGNSPVRPAG
jgi:hypothetical protein